MSDDRDKHPAAGEAAQDEDPARHAVSDFEAVPDDLAAAALAKRQAAADADEEALRCRAKAASVVAAAQADAERRKREGNDEALGWIVKATALERKSAKEGGESKHLQHAGRQKALAEQEEAKAADLTAERERLTEAVAGLDSKLSERGADRERLEAAVAAARAAGDVSLIAEGRRQLDATVEAIEGLSGERAKAAARLRQIGDGTETGPGLLTEALGAASRHRAALTKALDELYPGRQGADVRRALDEFRKALEGNMERLADEAKAKPGPGQAAVQHLGNTTMVQRR